LAEAGNINSRGNERAKDGGAKRGAWLAAGRDDQTFASDFLQAILGRDQLLGIYLGFGRCDFCNRFAFAPVGSGIYIEGSSLGHFDFNNNCQLAIRWVSADLLRFDLQKRK
jgi:hypothetical protein